MTARYFYDVLMPDVPSLGDERRGYTLLLRVLNPEGYPVSEEQRVRLEWPKGGLAGAAAHCQGD